jgi:hypothetical protein
MSDVKECPDCSREFMPTPDNEKFCSRCNTLFEMSFDEGKEYE